MLRPSTAVRVLAAIATVILLISILYKTSVVLQKSDGYDLHDFRNIALPPGIARPKAAFVVLIRNADIFEWKLTMRQVEDRFNGRYNYPYVFLNDEPFTDEFKRHARAMTDAPCEFGLISHDHWSYPDFIDQERARKAREELDKAGVVYGGLESYRHMCRYEAGFFWRHPLLLKYEYYWRVEPGVTFHCDMNFDPFAFMATNKKLYSFTVSLYEYKATIPTLWDSVREFMKENAELMVPDNFIWWISDDGGMTYNLCHFWSNFEIGSLEFFRSPAYRKFFDFLDKRGGFFYERWGDAPVHSIAAAMFLRPDQVHFWNEIGYSHPPVTHCPLKASLSDKCTCDPKENFDLHSYSCTKKWFDVVGIKYA